MPRTICRARGQSEARSSHHTRLLWSRRSGADEPAAVLFQRTHGPCDVSVRWSAHGEDYITLRAAEHLACRGLNGRSSNPGEKTGDWRLDRAHHVAFSTAYMGNTPAHTHRDLPVHQCRPVTKKTGIVTLQTREHPAERSSLEAWRQRRAVNTRVGLASCRQRRGVPHGRGRITRRTAAQGRLEHRPSRCMGEWRRTTRIWRVRGGACVKRMWPVVILIRRATYCVRGTRCASDAGKVGGNPPRVDGVQIDPCAEAAIHRARPDDRTASTWACVVHLLCLAPMPAPRGVVMLRRSTNDAPHRTSGCCRVGRRCERDCRISTTLP